MTPEEAIEHLKRWHKRTSLVPSYPLNNALILGIECLEWFLERRRTCPAFKNILLPSEVIK